MLTREIYSLRESPQFTGIPGRAGRGTGKYFFLEKKRRGKYFFWEKKDGASTFFSVVKKRGKDFFHEENRRAMSFILEPHPCTLMSAILNDSHSRWLNHFVGASPAQVWQVGGLAGILSTNHWSVCGLIYPVVPVMSHTTGAF